MLILLPSRHHVVPTLGGYLGDESIRERFQGQQRALSDIARSERQQYGNQARGA